MDAGADAGDELPDLSDTSNVLLLAPADRRGTQAQCLDALTQSPPEETHVLAVTYTGQPAEWAKAWDTQAGQSPAGGAILSVGQPETEFEDDIWGTSTIENPGDLTGIGIELSDSLSELADGADADEQLVACFDSVTALLQHADLQRSFRFLHVVTGRVRNADARCYYHLDPNAHDEQEMATLTGLFDATVERGDDGWTLAR
jgi:hypothetical protein